MISKGNVAIYIDNQLLDINQDDINLRMNDVVFDAEKVSTKQASYSFTFKVPSTPVNDKIFGYANDLAKPNKFRGRYSCNVYADEILIFEGSLVIQGFSTEDKEYSCNLVSIKIDTLEDIFADETLDKVDWFVDFQGASTINSINSDMSSKYFFPLVCYGAFQKEPYMSDEVGNEYTSKFVIDQYNKWWVESFYPSLNTLEHIRKCFEWKGYTCLGDAFQDPTISNVFESCNLDNDDIPIYNLGNPRFGKVSVAVNWNNRTPNNVYTPQELNFKYERVGTAQQPNSSDYFNFEAVDVWNVLDSKGNPQGVNIISLNENYIFDKDESIIVVPADGWYKIHMSVSAELDGYGEQFQGEQHLMDRDYEIYDAPIPIDKNIQKMTPIEFQLVRNYDYDAELIKGRKNWRWIDGYSQNDGEIYPRRGTIAHNLLEWETDYPHQKLYYSPNPTTYDSSLVQSVSQNASSMANLDSNDRSGGRISAGNSSAISSGGGSGLGSGARRRAGTGTYDENGNIILGYMHPWGKVMPYDPVVNDKFICGFSSLGDGTVSVIKDGLSWSKTNATKNEIFANVQGLEWVTTKNGNTTYTQTNYNKNEYKDLGDSGNRCESSLGTYLSGDLYCCVKLNKNDRLELLALQRDYGGAQMYSCGASIFLEIEAMDYPRSKAALKADGFSFTSTTKFPYDLNLSNFTNSKTKVSDYIKNACTALNLSLTMDKYDVYIDLNRGIKKNLLNAIDLDDRVNSEEVETSRIDYPRTMSLNWKVNTEEYGFEASVPQEYINDSNWFDYGDYGNTVIELSDDSYNTDTQDTSVAFSYTWYCAFTNELTSKSYMLPTIETSEYMADGYNYEEAMANDGYSLTQRFWFRDYPNGDRFTLSSWMDENVIVTIPVREYNGIAMSYKTSEKSLVTEYFNVEPMLSSNYLELEAFLSPMEYISIKNGSMVHFDDSLNYISSIQGFDPSGRNKTQLKLIQMLN